MDDDDLEYLDSLLDAPFKTNDSNGKQSSISSDVEKKRSKDKDRENGSSHKSSRRRSRSRSKEKRHKDKESKSDEKSKKERRKSKDRERDDKKRDKSRSRERERERKDSDKDKERSRRDKSRSRDKERRRRSKSRDTDKRRYPDDKRRDRDRYRDRKESKGSTSPDRRRSRRGFSPRGIFGRGRTPPNGISFRDTSPAQDLTSEEKDARTVFCMQLSQRVRARDLEKFFSVSGTVKDIRLINCNKTKRFKGIAYIEFKEEEAAQRALDLNGTKFLDGIPISVQHTHAEKNRPADVSPPPRNVHQGPMRLYVGSLHFNITEDMLRSIFEPFGKIDNIQLIMDTETGRSKGYGFITYHNAEDAKIALEQLNGFELAGRPMKVGNVTERLDVTENASLDTDEMDQSGIGLGATGRLQLMFKLAEGAGLAVPQAAATALLASVPQPPDPVVEETPQIPTQCFILFNMFDPKTETNMNWGQDIQDDVIEECNKHGGVLHVYVDVSSPDGRVYVKCPSIATAVLAVNALHGRWFAGRVIKAAYVKLGNYHELFPNAHKATNLMQPSRNP